MVKTGATSYRQTKFGILPRDEVIKLEVKGTKKGLQLLQKIADESRLVSPDLIKQIHKDCFEDILQDDAGRFRTIQVIYSSKEAPYFSKIPEMVHNLCEDIEVMLTHLPSQDNEDYISKLVQILAQFQHQFLVIHPFVDYNGRIARLFTNYILMRLKLPIIEIKIENKTDRVSYITALQKADDGNYIEIENIISESLAESFQKTRE